MSVAVTSTGTGDTSPETTYLHTQMPLDKDKTCARSTVDADLRDIGSSRDIEPVLADSETGESRKMALDLLSRILSFITESDGETDINTDGESVDNNPEYVSYKDIDDAPFYGKHIPDTPGFAVTVKQRDPPSDATSKKLNPAAPSFTFSSTQHPGQFLEQRPVAYALDPAVLSWDPRTYPTRSAFFPGWMQTPADSERADMAGAHSDAFWDPDWDNVPVPALVLPLPIHCRLFEHNQAGKQIWARHAADAPLPGTSPGHIESACGYSSTPSQDTRDDPPHNKARSTDVPLPKSPMQTWAQVVASQALQPAPVPSCPQQKWKVQEMAYSSPTRPTEATDASRDSQNEDRPPSIHTAEHPSPDGSEAASDQQLDDANEDLPWWLTNGSHLASPGESEKAIAMYQRIHKRPMGALRLLSIITSGLHHSCAKPNTGPLRRNINAGAGASFVQRKIILSAASAYRKLLSAEYQDPSSDLPLSELDTNSWPRSLRRDVAAAYEAMGPLFDVRLGEPFDLEAARSQQLLQRSTTSTFSGLGTPQQQMSIAKLHDALIRLERFNEARSAQRQPDSSARN